MSKSAQKVHFAKNRDFKRFFPPRFSFVSKHSICLRKNCSTFQLCASLMDYNLKRDRFGAKTRLCFFLQLRYFVNSTLGKNTQHEKQEFIVIIVSFFLCCASFFLLLSIRILRNDRTENGKFCMICKKKRKRKGGRCFLWWVEWSENEM